MPALRSPADAARSRGFTIVELMVAMTVSLLLLVALVGIFVNTSRTQNEMVKTNGVIENGRVALQILQEDIVHAGYLGGYLPGFDDLTSASVPGDAPSVIPNPCQPYLTWDTPYRAGLIGIPVQTSDVLPTGTGCLSPLTPRANSDVLVVRHVDTCVAGIGNCDDDLAGRLYFQTSYCAAERNAGTAVAADNLSITLGGNAASANHAYTGLTVRTVSGTGAGQYRSITGYAGSTRVATINTPWDVIPDSTTTYSFEYVLGTSAFPLHIRDCVGTGNPATLPLTSGTVADKRAFLSHIYYVTDVQHPEIAGQFVPTLVRSRLGTVSGMPTQLPPEALIDGIEAFRVELGIDDVSETGDPVDFNAAIDWTDAARTSASNRGDGTPDTFVRCTAAAPCDAADLSNVVAVKLYLLVRARDQTQGYTDTKSYCLGEPNDDGSCPVDNAIAASNDHYKRHVFTTSVRLTNISGRRETP